jgi:TatD DNase family protein
LSALKDFAIKDAMPLVDIGANFVGNYACSSTEFACQLARAAAANISHLVLTGVTVEDSKAASRLCEQWSTNAGMHEAEHHLRGSQWQQIKDNQIDLLPSLVFTAGVHPKRLKSCNRQTVSHLRSIAKHPHCVALGECGLEYSEERKFSSREVQIGWCEAQVSLAMELDMPLFMHARDDKTNPLGAAKDLLDILAKHNVDPSRICIHCFTGNREELEAFVSRGYCIGLTGAVGKQGHEHLRVYLQQGIISLGQLMIETDCPFMMPSTKYLPSQLGLQARKMEPCGMPGVCRAVAECLGLSPEDVARTTTENATRFFKLDQKPDPSTGDETTARPRMSSKGTKDDVKGRQEDLHLDPAVHANELSFQETSADTKFVHVELVSFGYLRGSGQPEADAIYSARHISNPHGGPKTHLSGLDARLRKEVMQCDGAQELFDEIYDDIELRATKTGATKKLTIAVGCDYGKHRSVTICEELALRLKRSGTQPHRFRVKVVHREEETWAGRVGQRRWQKEGMRGHRSMRERIVRDADEIAAENASENEV